MNAQNWRNQLCDTGVSMQRSYFGNDLGYVSDGVNAAAIADCGVVAAFCDGLFDGRTQFTDFARSQNIFDNREAAFCEISLVGWRNIEHRIYCLYCELVVCRMPDDEMSSLNFSSGIARNRSWNSVGTGKSLTD